MIVPVDEHTASPKQASRLTIAAAVAVFAVTILAFDSVAKPDAVPDFDHVWFAARAMLDGRDPYQLIGPGREFNWPWLLYYPLTAPTSILPLALLPLTIARAFYVAIPAALLALFLTRDGFGRLPLFISGAFIYAVKTAQWGPLVLCTLFLPWFGFFCPAKPNLGLGTLAGARSLSAFMKMCVAAALLVVMSLIIQPQWPRRWLQVIAQAPQPLSVLSIMGGPILLLALLRWRRWEARMLLMFALVPQTSGAVGTLPLLLVPRSFRAVTLLSILTYVPIFYAPQAEQTIEQWAYRETVASFLAVYLPVLWIVLRMPNQGPLPDRLESLAAKLPKWLRGQPGAAREPATVDEQPQFRSA